MSTKRSGGTPSPAKIDREWPHQIALPDDLCVENNYTLIRDFCERHGLQHLTRHVQAIWPNGKFQTYRLHCFADRAPAELFQAEFGGEFFDPRRDRDHGRSRGPWRREGEYRRVLTSGPLSVPAVLRN